MRNTNQNFQSKYKQENGENTLQDQSNKGLTSASSQKEFLKNRIYDKGFNIQTMPSVKRPETSSMTSRPLSAKLYAVRNRQQPPILQPQASILKNPILLNQPQFIQHYENPQDHQQQNFEIQPMYRGGGTMQRGRGEQYGQYGGVHEAPEYTTSNKYRNIGSAVGMPRSVSQNTMRPGTTYSMGMMNYNRSQLTTQQQQYKPGMTSSQFFNSARQGTPGYRPISQQQQQQQQQQQNHTNQQDIMNSQLLLNKMSGKLEMQKTYEILQDRPFDQHGRMIRNIVKESQFEGSRVEEDDAENYNDETESDINANFQKKMKNKSFVQAKREQGKLDKYIELIIKNVTNVDEFLYLIKRNEDDPYDLDVADYDDIQKKKPREYYTISSKGLCYYINEKPREFITLAYWLKERELYDQIRSLSFFTKFRRWKTLKMWRRNVTKHKLNTYKKQLSDKLFFLNPILADTLIQHRAVCCELEKLRFFELTKLQDTVSLDEFKSMQDDKRKNIREKIEEFSRRSRKIVEDGFNKSLEELRQKKNESHTEEEFARKQDNQNFLRLKESAYENLGFPDNMSYEKRSELRKLCSRFIRFSYLVDFLALEALTNIAKFSKKDLVSLINQLVNTEEENISRDRLVRNPALKHDPLFLCNVVFDPIEIPEDEIEEVELEEYIPPPQGSSKIEEWNPVHHVQLIENETEKDPNKQEDDTQLQLQQQQQGGGGNGQQKQLVRLQVRNLHRLWIRLNPNQESFIDILITGFNEGMNSIQAFERWSKHDDMTKYAGVLEEWDDMVGEDWDLPDSNYLNPNDQWFDANEFDEFKRNIKSLLNRAFDRADYFVSQYQAYLEMYWTHQRIDYKIFESEELANPGESFQFTLELLHYQKELFEKQIPFQADLGLLRLDSKNLKKEVLPSPDNIIHNFNKFLPSMLSNRINQIKKWLNQSILDLNTNLLTIDVYVQQTINLRNCQAEFPNKKDKISLYGHLYTILPALSIEIKKSDQQNLTEALQMQTLLLQAIRNAEESTENKLERFAKQITNSDVPALEKNTIILQNQISDFKFLSSDMDTYIAIKELEELEKKCTEYETSSKKINKYQETLNLPQTRFETLETVRQDINLRLNLRRSLVEWKNLILTWLTGKFTLINTEEIKSKAEYYTKIVNRSKVLPQNPILDELRELVTNFRDTMPIVIALRNIAGLTSPYYKGRLMEIIKRQIELDENLTLKNLIDMNIVEYQKDVQDLATQGIQETILDQQLKQISEKWKNMRFIVKPYKEDTYTDVYILGEIDEILQALDETIVQLNNILGSRYLRQIRHVAENQYKEILLIQDILDDWLVCQKNWMYLENIFTAQDIKKQLPQEQREFEQVDKFFKNFMRKTNQSPFVYRQCILFPGVLEQFRKNKDILNHLQKQLENYLEVKRQAFPRFYFLSNDELLEILANSNNPQSVQPHMRKCFDNIYKLDFGDEKGNLIYALISGEGERLKLSQTCQTSGKIEEWLKGVQDQMQDTIKKVMKSGFTDYQETDRKNWVTKHVGQVVATISQVTWTQFTEHAINSMDDNPNSLYEWYTTNVQQLQQLIELVRSNLEPVRHKIIVALVTTDVHARDIIEKLTEEGISSTTEFIWQQQLRYELNDICYVSQVNAKLEYGYEYMGATSRLVITPLTDRCWMTITGALNIKLGAAPAGPAGTGKTESTKDLAKALGMLCVVFNCSEQIEYTMMGRLFSGLAQQGAWACLDEFNRIDIEVLSVIAQQLLDIRVALIKNEKNFNFIDRDIPLKNTVGVFITMNPGYAGRTELPDNLKVLFRPVSMMIPDYSLIAEIMLFAEGFDAKNCKDLAKKMVKLYKLASEQLSKQDHYDFGMRAVKSVLVMAGSLKRSEPNLSEDVVLIRAMVKSNIPKFLKEDIPLFQALIQDLFPSVEIPPVDYGELQNAILISLERQGLQKNMAFVSKVIELFDTFNVRFGVMLVGQTGSGKTQCYQILRAAMKYLRSDISSKDQRYQLVEQYVLNPKCVTMGELYGEVHPLTKEWNDGLASSIMRNFATSETPDKKWVIFDGPVDALWIENMNTVLDDNMMLCLANGQRIKLRNEMRMLFEVQDLAVASPATVSRCGMVYLNYEDLSWKPYVLTWLNQHFNTLYNEDNEPLIDDELKKYIYQLFEDSVPNALDKIKNEMSEPIITSDLQLVVSLCNLLEAFISRDFEFKSTDKIENKKKFITYSFTFAFTWSIGATVYDQYQDKFNIYIKENFSSILFPNADTVYGYYLDPITLQYKPWADKTPDFIYEKDAQYFELLVPTSNTIKYSYIMDKLLSISKPTFITGGSGVGKSVLIQNQLKKMQETSSIDPIFVIFSAQTSSLITQTTLESKLEKKSKQLLGARATRKNIVFIDDVNMPAVEEYGAQPPIEFLRLMLDKKGFYDRKSLLWKEVIDTTLLVAAAPPGGGRNTLTKRFTRHFNLLCIPQPSKETLTKIFGSILNGFLSTGFQESVKRLSDTIVQSTIEIFTRILKEKLPIPSKFHYTFNLRDVSKVFQGLLSVRPIVVRESEQFTRLWIHESARVFHDRLINDEDRKWFNNLIIELLTRSFKLKWQYDDIFVKNRIFFTHLLKIDSENVDYEEVTDLKKLLTILEVKLEDYMSIYGSKMKLVFFEDALEHVLRVARILKQPRGNAMLIGVGGSGKQSLTKFASFILEYQLFSIEITKGYNADTFKEDMKSLMFQAGIDGKKISFLFTDNQIINESFLEDINNLLNSGEIPNLFTPDEREKIKRDVQPINAALKRPDSPDVIYRTFVERVRDNLHVILCMSPVGDSLRVRCRKFPSLVDCCTLDWYSPWPLEALLSVSSRLLQELDLPNEEIREGLSYLCAEIHLTTNELAADFEAQLKRKVYNTPKSYLDLIQLYINTLEQKRQELGKDRQRLATGITKLEETNKTVAELQIKLTELQPQLIEQNEKVRVALIQVAAETEVAQKQEAIVEVDAQKVSEQAMKIQAIADEAQAELDKVMPELIAAKKALENIDKESLIQMKSYLKPPEIVIKVMESVCILLQEKTDWTSAKIIMQDINYFISRLQNYDKEHIPELVLTKLRKKLQDPEFDEQKIAQRVPAAASLAMWCKTMNTFSVVNKNIEPKKKNVEELQKKLNAAKTQLDTKQRQLAEVQQKVQKLKRDCEEMEDKKQELFDGMQLTENRLIRAEKLKYLLADEGKRWGESIQVFNQLIENLVGDVFLAAATISYLGPFTGVFRNNLLEKWQKSVIERHIPLSEEYSLIKTLGDPVEIRDWQMYGLPSDTVSQDNAIMATKGQRWPLLIDPQLQANKWLKNMEKTNSLKVLKVTDNSFSNIIKGALQNGFPILIQDIELTLEPSLDPIFGKQYFTSEDGRQLIKFGDNFIDYDDNFRLYLTTKIPNPNYLPEVFIKVTVINFTVTFGGLEDQLLGDVVKAERPEIEEQRDKNIINLSNYRKTLTNIEKDILKMLAESEENILDDEPLIQKLEDSKQTSGEIAIKFEESRELEIKIEQIRNQYKDVSIRGSILYFVISDMSLVDPMYQYSLQYIMRLFNTAIYSAKKSNDLQDRLNILIDNITKFIFKNVCRGLFEAHKLIFSFLIAISINKQNSSVTEIMWNTFLRGSGVFDKLQQPNNPDSILITQGGWDLAYYLELNFNIFKGFTSHIISNYSQWKNYIISEDPIEEQLPEEWENKLDIFEKMLVLKVFRPEKLLFQLSNYVKHYLGEYYLESPSIRMEEIYEDSDRKTPIIFVLSQGADPTTQVLKFAKDRNYDESLKTISLGQGQGKYAAQAIELGKKEGFWCLLQNCHLARTWMPSLEIIVEQLAIEEGDIHQDFRLFLTSMPASYFPVSILQNGIKLTTEPPRGIKANLKRSFGEITNEFLNSCTKKEPFHKLLFGLSFFHAIIQERRKFGPLGWNIRYEFNDSDLETSRTVLKMLLNEQDTIPWDALLNVTGQINYGGRVTDDWDRRCLNSILKKFYTEDILEDKYYFSESDVYYVPPVGPVDNYRDYINSLPIRDNPDVFGMHENANITYQMQESDKILSIILDIQPRISSGVLGKTSDEIVEELADKILQKLPNNLIKENGNRELWKENEQGLIPSLSTLLLQEILRFNTLLNTMRSSLDNLKKAISGFVVMSQELDSMYSALMKNSVPKNWEKIAYPSLKPLASWIEDLIQRVKFIEKWLTEAYPVCYWLPGLFFPHGFLTGVLQTYARKYQIPIDQLSFSFKIMDSNVENTTYIPIDGVNIYGFYLEGASWDRKKRMLIDSNPGEMYTKMPVIYFNPTVDYKPKQTDYQCPVYKTSLRAGTLSTTGESTNFILTVDLPTNDNEPDFYVLRGAALLCQLNE